MPELTNSRVGSSAGTSELEATMVWPFDLKYSRKLERISADFISAYFNGRHRGAAVPPSYAANLPYFTSRARTPVCVR